MSYYFYITRRLADAHTFGQRAHAIAETLGDLPLQVTASFELGVAAVASGDYVGG